MNERGLLERGDARHLEGLPVEEGALPAARRVKIPGDRLIDDARRHLAVLLEPHKRRPERDAPDEVARAVDGIHDEPALRRPAGAELLAQDAVLGAGRAERPGDHLLGLPIGLSDRGAVGLQRGLDAAPEMRQRDLAARAGGLDHRLEDPVHPGILYRRVLAERAWLCHGQRRREGGVAARSRPPFPKRDAPSAPG